MGTRNWRASDLAVRDVAIKPVFTCKPDDDVHEALKAMRKHQVRRLPVVHEDSKLAGIVCLDELVLHAEKADSKKHVGISYEDVVNTMQAICEHRAAEAPKHATMAAGAAVTL